MIQISDIYTATKYILTNSNVELLLFEVVINENKGTNILQQYNHIVYNTTKQDTLVFNLQGELSSNVPFNQYDTDSMTYSVSVTEYTSNKGDIQALSSVGLFNLEYVPPS